jgi:hypothetical protein
MSRNLSGVYSLPAGSVAVDNTIIDPVAFNTMTADLETDANTARPIVAGGTGASTAAAARTNLGATAVGASVFTAADAAAARSALEITPLTNGVIIGTKMFQWGSVIATPPGVTVTFPQAFSAPPIVIVAPNNGGPASALFQSITASSVLIQNRDNTGTLASGTVHWHAEGNV